jgi:hypothetical protein
MLELFTDLERIFIEVREGTVNGTLMDPPSTVYLDGDLAPSTLYLDGDLRVVRFDYEPTDLKTSPIRCTYQDFESEEDDQMSDAGAVESDDEEDEEDEEDAEMTDAGAVESDDEEDGQNSDASGEVGHAGTPYVNPFNHTYGRQGVEEEDSDDDPADDDWIMRDDE